MSIFIDVECRHFACFSFCTARIQRPDSGQLLQPAAASIGSTIVRSNLSQLPHAAAAEVQSYAALSIWVSRLRVRASLLSVSILACCPFPSLSGDDGTLFTAPSFSTACDLVARSHPHPIQHSISETRFKEKMNHIGGMKRERDDDDEVICPTSCQSYIETNHLLALLSPLYFNLLILGSLKWGRIGRISTSRWRC